MTQEQKAKAYDEVVNKLRGFIRKGVNILITKADVQDFFPELKESEDGRIKKGIISILKHYKENGESICPYPFVSIDEAIAWIEKQEEHQKIANKEYTFKAIPRLLEMIQPTDRAKSYCQKLIDSLEQEGYNIDAKIIREWLKVMNGEKVVMATMDEQKPVDKVEPKFHEGEWITNGDYIWKIIEVKPLDYILQSQEDNIVDDTISHVDNHFHPFTIQDAKDGDVLAVTMYPEGTWIGMFKERNGCTFSSYCFVNTKGTFKLGTYNHGNGRAIHPVTKEQCNLLFQKMKEAGYEWNSETKRPKKL